MPPQKPPLVVDRDWDAWQRTSTNGDAAPRYAIALGEPDGAFAQPQFEKFTDMQGFLLLDPIHETDSSGWPYRNPDVAA